MSRMPGRFAVGTVLAVVAALLLGWLVAGQISNALAIEFTDKELPAETPSDYAPLEVGPLAPVGEISVQGADIAVQGADPDPLLETSSRFLREAVDGRDVDATASPVDVEVVVSGAEEGSDPESYSIDASAGSVMISAPERRGAGQALFRVADLIGSGHGWSAVGTDGVVTPALGHRFVDTGAVGVEPDLEAYLAQDDYQHSSGALEQVVLEDAPYIDEEMLAVAEAEWRDFIDHVASYGYNGVLIPGFLEYVNFDRLGDGFEVYAADSPYRARHEVMRDRVGEMWKYAHDMGLDVVFKTDMVALTGPLEEYLERETDLDPSDPYLWEVYRAGLDELLGEFDWAEGVMLRVGEAGSIYNHEGWDYYSELEITNADHVRTMLEEFSAAAAVHDATVFFRTWSVGVGDVGDMHTNPETYDRLMDEVDIENLVVSTKFVMGDFDSFLPLNPTLATGDEERLVEMQGRREFEAFSSIPNDMGPAHQSALQGFLGGGGGDGAGEGENVNGLWMWTQDGGPWRAGPMSLYLKEGLWQLYDLNVYTGGRLGWDPDADLSAATSDWIRRMLTDDPAAAESVSAVFERSREAVLDGFYIRPYAEEQVFALGLEPPPMMWMFKWDIVSGDSAALSAVYHATRGRVDEAIAAGERAVDVAEEIRAEFADVDASAFHEPETHALLAESLEYEVDLLRTLQSFRATFLNYYEWVDTGSTGARDAFEEASAQYHRSVTAHEQRWTGNPDFPPFNFFAADTGVEHAERNSTLRIAAWVLLAVALAGLLLVRPLRTGGLMPWRVREVVPSSGVRDRLLVFALPAVAVVASRIALSGAMSVWYPVATIGSLLLFGVAVRAVLRWRRPDDDGFWLWSVLGGALLVRTAILTAALSVRGPGTYWLRFWTHEEIREVYVTVSFAAFAYMFIAVVVVLTAVYRLRIWQSLGMVLVGLGGPMVALGALLWTAGLETALTTINDELALVPLGLSRILGLTVHLGIPQSLPVLLLCAGLALAVVGLALAWIRGRGRSRAPVAA